MDIDQPNELDSQPNVSNELTQRLPEATRGQINNIVSNNPQIEKWRRIRHKEAMEGNTFHLKTGKYSKQLPKYLIDYLSFIDNLPFEGQVTTQEVIVRLLKGNLKRIALAEYREQVEHNTNDPQLSRLIRDTYVMAMGISQTPSLLQKPQSEPLELAGLTPEQLYLIDQFVTGLRELVYGSNQEDETITVIPS